MELDDLKNTWDNISKLTEKQPHLTPKIIDQMIQKKYNSKINKIAYPEITGMIICLIGTVFIGVNFYKLNTFFLQTVGIVSSLLLVTVSAISLLSIRKLTITGDVNQPYAETLKIFASRKLEFYKLQKINITLSYLLLVTIIILLAKLFNGRDITDSKYFWMFSFTFGYIFLVFYSKLVSKSYKKTVTQAEELLQELKS